jgi:two-component system sensor histidine kinase KdpD
MPTGIVPSVKVRIVLSIAGVAAVTVVARQFVPVNATTVGFAYLVLVLLIASIWGFIESLAASLAATLAFNFFFLPPVGTLTIADPQNWVALIAFLTTSLVASRLSTLAKQREHEAIERQQALERLYTFSRALLLIDSEGPFPKQLVSRLADIFNFGAVVLFDRRTADFYRAGPMDFEGLDEQLRDAALSGVAFSDVDSNRTITAVRLGAEPIASLALQGPRMHDSVLQGIANLVAIGLERARAQALAHQIEATKQSDQLRTTLIDAMAHEFKTPLTSIRAATSSLLAEPEQPVQTRTELIRVADEEAEHLRTLIDDAVEMARLDVANIVVQLTPFELGPIVREVVDTMQNEIDSRPVHIFAEEEKTAVLVDFRLIKLAIKQLIDNALKYSSPDTPIRIAIGSKDNKAEIRVTDYGHGISPSEQARVFERFWRSASVKKQMPGTGLGLSIAQGIARAHNGDLTVSSQPGETTFCLSLPIQDEGGTLERRANTGR